MAHPAGVPSDPPRQSVAFTDVQYEGEGARAACVVAPWTAATATEEHVVDVATVKPYRPGAFYERELPCLLAVLAAVRAPLAAIVVDGYVVLDDAGAAGLGAHLHDALERKTPVVGVAKTKFRDATFAIEVFRGQSRTPLYVTARGIDAQAAARLVTSMHGPHRVPTLLTRVDHLARGWERPRA